MKRVILTGGSGFVGANLARRLLSDGHELHLLLRPEHETWRIADILVEVRPHEIDLRDSDRLASIVRAIRPEWIFHLATYGAYPTQTDAERMARINVAGTMNLAFACLKTEFEAFINTGSSSEYGLKDHAPSEDECLAPNSEYAVTKTSATLFCRDISISHQVHVSTLRLYSVYGPFEEPTRLIPTLIARGLLGKLPRLANPETARDFVYVDDVVEAYLLTADDHRQEFGAIFNVGTGTQTTLREAVNVARSVLDISVEPKWKTLHARPWDTDVWMADNTKIGKALGWQPRFDFEKGFRATVEWFKENPKHFARYSGPEFVSLEG